MTTYRTSEKERARKSAWRKANPEKMRAAVRAWANANPGRKLATTLAWQKAHPEKAWAKVNPEKNRAHVAAWRKANPEKVRAKNHRRRACKVGNGGSFTPAQWRAKNALHGHRCFYCKAAGKLTIDHAVPIARGGTSDIGNLLPSCMACNSRKGTRTAAEFLKAT